MDRFPIIISIKQAIFNIYENWELNKANRQAFIANTNVNLQISYLLPVNQWIHLLQL